MGEARAIATDATGARGAEHPALAACIRATARLTGTFRLRSGAAVHAYFDQYLFEADPYLLREVAAELRPLIPGGTEVLARLELGGIPVVPALSPAAGLPTAFVRKTATAYGTARLAEGAEVAGRRVCSVAEVVTTGGQVRSSATSEGGGRTCVRCWV